MHISRCLQSTRPEAGPCTQQHTLPKRSVSQGKSDSSEAKLTRPASTGPLLPLAPQTGNKHHQRAGLRAAVPSLLPLSPPVTVPKQEGELGELRTGGKRARLGNQRALRARAPRPAAGTAPPGSRGCGRGGAAPQRPRLEPNRRWARHAAPAAEQRRSSRAGSTGRMRAAPRRLGCGSRHGTAAPGGRCTMGAVVSYRPRADREGAGRPTPTGCHRVQTATFNSSKLQVLYSNKNKLLCE